MNKEVIYIDVNDDITNIVNRIKDSKANLIALVPPKKIGVLQSAVNLKLLIKAAKTKKKILVIITNNQALIRLAAINRIPISKSLNSKPQLVKMPELEANQEEDIIDGAQLPISEVAGIKSESKKETKKTDVEQEKLKPAKVKVPNYNKFRKRLFIGAFGLILLTGFLVWAIFFAPTAEIVVKTKTKNKKVSEIITLVNDSKDQNILENKIFSQTQLLTKKKVVEFVPTGEKEIGQAATGQITLTRKIGGTVKVPIGTGFSRGDCTFVTQKDVVVPAGTLEIGTANIIPGKVTVNVKATKIGEQCNIEAGTLTTKLSGFNNQSTAMTGGSKKIVKIVTADDLKRVEQKIEEESDDKYIKELRNKFDSSIVIIDDSLDIKRGQIVKPEVDQVIEQEKFTVEQEITFTLHGIAHKDINQLVKHKMLKNKKKLKIYQSGDEVVDFMDYVVVNNTPSVRILTEATIGPNIEEKEIKKFAAGKVTGEIKNKYQKIDGVEKVEITYKPFWVSTVPKNLEKIKVEIDLSK